MNQSALPTPLARIHGEPLLEIPPDLYIPPDALEVILDTFEGPLDLLLYLIRRHNLDVLDIPMAKLTAQYMEYVNMMQARQLELAADYLLMAALLIEIKSRMLLPRPAATEDDAADPRAELVRRLLEYERMKLAAQGLDALPRAGRDFVPVQVWMEQVVVKRLPQVSPEDMRNAWLGLLAKARVSRHHKVSRAQLSVREHMSRILRQLRQGGFVAFADLFDVKSGVAELVVTFLAILELTKESLVAVSQQAPFSPLYVRLAGEADA